MAIVMAVRGRFASAFPPIIGRVSEYVESASPADTVLVCRDGRIPKTDLASFAAILMEKDCEVGPTALRIGIYENLDHIEAGDLVLIDGHSGWMRTLYRRASSHNALFVTKRCSSNCIMCSQPPQDRDDGQLAVCLRIIELLQADPPSRLGITGGEPTLLRPGFLELVAALTERLSDTAITCLSNGRAFADASFTRAVGEVSPQRLRFSIPLHASIPNLHDYISQASGAFNETMAGLYNLAASGVETELRVVLHALSVPHLIVLAEYIHRKLPFVQQVAFMGLERMGYVKKNHDLLWIEPADYAQDLASAIEYLYRRDMNVSIYNLPLCQLSPTMWAFARQSISDHKHVMDPKCSSCDVRIHCAGFFSSSNEWYRARIQPVNWPPHSAR